MRKLLVGELEYPDVTLAKLETVCYYILCTGHLSRRPLLDTELVIDGSSALVIPFHEGLPVLETGIEEEEPLASGSKEVQGTH